MNHMSMDFDELPGAARSSVRMDLILVAAISVMLGSGCASNYSPRADLSSVQVIGVVVPPGSSEPGGAEDVMELYNVSVGEDRLKNSAVGAGAGAAVGTAAGVGVGALTGCTFAGPWAGMCWAMFGVGGAVLGGTTGAVAGATVDTQEQVEAAPVHLYEVNRVLPALTQEYLASAVLQKRALQIVREQGTPVTFVPASWNGQRYMPNELVEGEKPDTEINLVLTEMSVSMKGKAKEDPKLILIIHMQWALTKWNPETQADEVWDALSASYESRKYRLSKWMADDGMLLEAETNAGLQIALTYAFVDLPAMAEK